MISGKYLQDIAIFETIRGTKQRKMSESDIKRKVCNVDPAMTSGKLLLKVSNKS